MGKGRSKELVEARDMRLFERYYYWTETRRLRFDDTIRKLSEEEFFISEARVIQVVRRMIQAGATVDGRRIERPMFAGFRCAIGAGRPSTACLPGQDGSGEAQLELAFA